MTNVTKTGEGTHLMHEDRDEFNRLHRAANSSAAYTDAVREALPGLPDWLIPFSILDGSVLNRLALELRLMPGDALLDVGCGGGGPGLFIAQQSGARVIGIDIADGATRTAQRLADAIGMAGRARFVACDATNMALPDESVTAAMSVDALMFIDAERVLREIARVLRPGGKFVMIATECTVEPFTPTIVRDYTPYFEAAGFNVTMHIEHRDQRSRQQRFYQAISRRADRLRSEMGPIADQLIGEANTALERFKSGNVRVRPIFLSAARHNSKSVD